MRMLSFGRILNCAIGCSMIVIMVFAVDRHVPEDGVKVYVDVAWLFKAGLHVPVIPFNEVIGKAAKTSPWHIGFTGSKVGVIMGFTVIVKVAVEAHCPEVGVKV
jgi:hypothetical protein